MGLGNEVTIKSPNGMFRIPAKPNGRITNGIHYFLEKSAIFGGEIITESQAPDTLNDRFFLGASTPDISQDGKIKSN